MNVINLAKVYAKYYHRNQTYGSRSYIEHLEEVLECLITHTNEYSSSSNLYIATLFHDILEDTTVTYVQLCEDFNDAVAEYVHCVTRYKEDGKDKVINSFKRIYNCKYPTPALIKTADRLVNLKHSIEENKISILRKYLFEDTMFRTYVLPKVNIQTMVSGYLSMIDSARKIVERSNNVDLKLELLEFEKTIKDYFIKYYEDFKINSTQDHNDDIIIYVNKEKVVFDDETITDHDEFFDYYYSEVDRLEEKYSIKIYLQYNFDDYFKNIERWLESQKELEPEFAKIINDNLWELI